MSYWPTGSGCRGLKAVEARLPLDTVLHGDFAGLRAARVAEDAGIKRYFDRLDAAALDRRFPYTNSKGIPCVEMRPWPLPTSSTTRRTIADRST